MKPITLEITNPVVAAYLWHCFIAPYSICVGSYRDMLENRHHKSLDSIGPRIIEEEASGIIGKFFQQIDNALGDIPAGGPILDPPMLIGPHEVTFTDTGIQIGCQRVSKEQVKAIHDRLFPETKGATP